MKALLLILFLATGLTGQSHIEPYKLNEQGVLYYDYVFQDNSLSKEDLSILSKTWLARTFRDSKDVEMYSDEDVLIGKGLAETDRFLNTIDYLRFTINIFFKEGKARIVIDNIKSYTIGNEYIDPNNENPIENMYWINGDISKRERTGFNRSKNKRIYAIELVIESWVDAMKAGKGNYSDF